MCSASACATSSCFWLNEALSSPMRRCGVGAKSSAKPLPTACAAAVRGPVTSGTSMRCSFASRACSIYLWRAVDQDGVVLDILVQSRRDAKAAKRFFRRLLKGLQYVPRVIVTDKLRSHGVAHRQLLPKGEHRQSRYLNNRAENSHRPTRRRERQMQRFKSPEQAQDFLSAHAFIHGHFHPRRHLLTAILIVQFGLRPSTSGSGRHALSRLRSRYNTSAGDFQSSDTS
jgi:putative transposase